MIPFTFLAKPSPLPPTVNCTQPLLTALSVAKVAPET